MRDRTTRLTLYAAIVFLILVAATLVYNGVHRYQQYRQFQKTNAETVALGVATEVAQFIRERHRMVTLFTEEHLDQVTAMRSRPVDVESIAAFLEQRAHRFFPDLFAITILDAGGNPLWDDFDGLIGDLCLDDARLLLETGRHSVRVHPNPVVYHFDIMSPWQKDGASGLFFISFSADYLGQLLRVRQIPGHQLLLIDMEAQNLIEITPDGARINWPRLDYRLQEDELARMLAAIPVSGTRWHVVDLHQPGLFATEQQRIIVESLLIFTIFLLVILVTVRLLWLEAQRRIRAEKSKDEFVSLVSHELRTPLTAIRGTLGLLTNEVTGELNPKTREMSAMALRNAEYLGLLVDDLLDLQKLGAGKMVFKKEDVPIATIAEQAIASYGDYARRFGASFHLDEEIPNVRVHVDPQRMEQVLANLLSNAVKYGAKGDRINIGIRRIGKRVRVTVTDHGEGIPPEFQSRLFRAFEQSGGERQHAIRGTGLGLYIARAILREHDGRIGFVSRPGEGADFWFDLPIVSDGD
ncbi:MAG TPA: HAMP domain-containing histidine kinase [Gammaproteobacteria bacterium]|nr:HAMP domain-containing histidine kinase [Gammaproteobacteria bacterium]